MLKCFPHFLLREVGLVLDMSVDLALEVTSACKLHDYAELLRGLIEECFFIASYVLVVNRGKDSHFV